MKKWSWKALVLALALAVIPAAAAQTVQAATQTTQKNHWDGDSYIKDGKKVKGLVTIGKKQYFFNKSGILLKNRVAYKITVNNKVQYFDINEKGVAVRWTGAAEMAAKRLHALKAVPTKPTASNLKSGLKKAFLWSAKLKFVNLPAKKMNNDDALEYYAKLGFAKNNGDCTCQAATFAMMARVLKYDARMVRGLIPTAVNASGKPVKFQSHAWADMKINKVRYVFDPNFNTGSDAKQVKKVVYGDKKTKGFYFQYGDKGTYTYYSSSKKPMK